MAFKTYKREDDAQTIWNGSTESTKEQVKAGLLEGYEKEAVVSVRNKICDTVADVAREEEEESSAFRFCVLLTRRILARAIERAFPKCKVP